MENHQKYAHNIIQNMSEKMFSPINEEKAIFYALAKDGPQILTKLGKTIKNYGEWETNRWTIKRKIHGLKNTLGLIQYEYIVEKEHENRIPGKDGKYFCLSTKGLFASLSTGIQLEKTNLFKKYIEFIKNRLEYNYQFKTPLDDKLKDHLIDIFTMHIKNSILLFFAWHDAYGINLKNKVGMNWYFVDFFENLDEHISQRFPQIKDKNLESQYKTILQEHHISSKSLSTIKKQLDKTNNNDKTKKLEFYFKMTSPFVFEWYRFFDKLQMVSPVDKPYNINAVPSFVINNPNQGIDIGDTDYKGEPIEQRIKIKVSEILEKQIRHRIPNYTKGSTVRKYKKSGK